MSGKSPSCSSKHLQFLLKISTQYNIHAPVLTIPKVKQKGQNYIHKSRIHKKQLNMTSRNIKGVCVGGRGGGEVRKKAGSFLNFFTTNSISKERISSDLVSN